jgi:hypothetical protein
MIIGGDFFIRGTFGYIDEVGELSEVCLRSNCSPQDFWIHFKIFCWISWFLDWAQRLFSR